MICFKFFSYNKNCEIRSNLDFRMFTVICKINFSSFIFFGVTRSVCVYSTAERSLLACWQTDKVLFLFSNVKTEKPQRSLVNSKIINQISLPKLQEFCNENAAKWRPSLPQCPIINGPGKLSPFTLKIEFSIVLHLTR